MKIIKRKKSLKAWVKELKATPKNSDKFSTQDDHAQPITITWRKITDINQLSHDEKEEIWALSRGPFLNHEINYLKTQQPEEIVWPRLKPYFANGTENVDWINVEKELETFYKKEEFNWFDPNYNEVYFLVEVRNAKNILIAVQDFFATTKFGRDHSINIGSPVLADEVRNNGYEKIILSIIFLIAPNIQQIATEIRKDKQPIIDMFYSLGFTRNKNPDHSEQDLWIVQSINKEERFPYSTFLKYNPETTEILQNQAKKLLPQK